MAMTADVTQTTSATSLGTRSERDSALIHDAKRWVRAPSASATELLAQAKQLKDAGHFDFACRLLALARKIRTNGGPLRHLLAQQHALCTYKNPDAPLIDRLDDALSILEEEINLRTTIDQESLGIAGAIFKRKWQADGDKEHLDQTAWRHP
jgi:hypothetical protein